MAAHRSKPFPPVRLPGLPPPLDWNIVKSRTAFDPRPALQVQATVRHPTGLGVATIDSDLVEVSWSCTHGSKTSRWRHRFTAFSYVLPHIAGASSCHVVVNAYSSVAVTAEIMVKPRPSQLQQSRAQSDHVAPSDTSEPLSRLRTLLHVNRAADQRSFSFTICRFCRSGHWLCQRCRIHAQSSVVCRSGSADRTQAHGSSTRRRERSPAPPTHRWRRTRSLSVALLRPSGSTRCSRQRSLRTGAATRLPRVPSTPGVAACS
jgi:hypothetical protein